MLFNRLVFRTSSTLGFDPRPRVEAVHGLAEIIIGKQRHGPIGTVNLAFVGRITKFDNLADPL